MSKWKRVRIPDVLFFQEGPGVRNTQYTNSGIKLLNVANLQDGEINLSTSERYISEEEAYGRYQHFLVDDGDLIIASSGIKVDYFEKKMGFIKKEHLPLCMNTSTIRFKVLDSNRLYIRYFMYYLKTISLKKQLGKLITGSAQLNFGPSHLKKITFPLPPLETQNQIAKTLDTATELLALRKQQLAELDNLIKSTFNDMFGNPVVNEKGWGVSTLGDCCNLIKDGPHASPNYVEDGIPFISVNNIIKGYWDLQKVKYITREDYERFSRRCKPEYGDVLYTKGGTTGYAKYIDRDFKFMNWVHIAVLKYKREILNGLFLENMLNSDYCYNQSQQYTRGIANRDLVLNQMSKIIIFLPPYALQQQFAEIVNKIKEQKALIQKAINETQYLFDSLMSQYFE